MFKQLNLDDLKVEHMAEGTHSAAYSPEHGVATHAEFYARMLQISWLTEMLKEIGAPCVIAGGFVFNSVINYLTNAMMHSDVDVFFWGMSTEEFYQKVTEKILVGRIKRWSPAASGREFYDKFDLLEVKFRSPSQAVQFMNKSEYKSADELVSAFSIDYVQLYVTIPDFQLMCSTKALECLKTWSTPLSTTHPALNIKAMNKGLKLRVKIDVSGHHEGICHLNELCWFALDKLPETMLSDISFDQLWGLHPPKKSDIVMHQKDIPAHRYLKSYMSTPSLEMVDLTKSSYMFSGTEGPESGETPKVLTTLLQHVNEKFGYNYNQIVVNWYENGNDYIPPHSDWMPNKTCAFPVTMITLCEPTGIRELCLDPVCDFISGVPRIVLINGTIVTLGGMTNTYFHHGIPKDSTVSGRRIGITFRSFDDSAET